MRLHDSVKCSSLFFIVFLLYPKHIHSANPVGKQQEYFHAVRKSINEVKDIDFKFRPADWSSNILRQAEDEPLLGVDEDLGFDLSDDEIRKFKLWRKGIIPYYIDALSYSDKVLRDRIRLLLNVVNGITKLSFMELPSPPKDDKTRWVFFVNRRGQLGCSDHSILNFTSEGVQQVILGYDCLSTGGELAEAVLAIAGVPPQHNSPDRDDYIKIMYENIAPEKKYLFQKLKNDQWLFHDLKYDFASAGHFHHHKHSVNGRATIEMQDAYAEYSLGENHGFTSKDIKKLRMLYNYIVKKKEDNGPDCDKLFRKGHNYQKGSGIIWDLKSRQKPNRYLGLPDQVTDKTPVEHQEVGNEKHPADDEDMDGDNDYDDSQAFKEHKSKTPHVFRKQHEI